MTRNIFEPQTCTDIHIHLCISHVTHGLTRVEKGNNTRLSAYDSQSVCNISSSDKLPVPAIHALHCPLTSRGMIGGEKASPRNRTCQFVHTPALRCPLRPRQPVSTRTRRTAQAHHLPPPSPSSSCDTALSNKSPDSSSSSETAVSQESWWPGLWPAARVLPSAAGCWCCPGTGGAEAVAGKDLRHGDIRTLL